MPRILLVMLESLAIENYAVVKKVCLNLAKGMSAITGETGAGKSIAVDALELVLGGRADARSVRNGAQTANICATFSTADAPRALAYLKEKDLLAEDCDLCILRRVITKDGRSRAYINDVNVNTSILRELAPMLINIHGQHDGQHLLKPEHQIQYLDAYAELGSQISEVTSLFHTYSSGKKHLTELADLQKNTVAEYKLTHYQIAELEKLSPKKNEFTDISNEYDRLNHVQTLLEGTNNVITGLNDENSGLLTRISGVKDLLVGLTQIDKSLSSITNTIDSAQLSLDDALSELETYTSKLEYDPERINAINERMEQYTKLARKYSVSPNDLYDVLEQLQLKAQTYTSIKDEIEQCKTEVIQAKNEFLAKAHELSELRKQHSIDFTNKVTEMLHSLSMPFAVFTIEFTESSPQENGIDAISFRFNANPGMEPDLISRTASGGEISRIALAILVLTANKISAPTLIFDEIDTGISGQTAAVTGSLLRKLGLNSQVVTVTHLPQVAASAHHQFEVRKQVADDETSSSIHELDANGRIHEIARLLGASEITDNALANASELLNIQAQ